MQASLRTVTAWELGESAPSGRFVAALDRSLLSDQPAETRRTDERDLTDEDLWSQIQRLNAEAQRRYYEARSATAHASEQTHRGMLATPPDAATPTTPKASKRQQSDG